MPVTLEFKRQWESSVVGGGEGHAEQRQEAGSEVGIVSCSVCLLYPTPSAQIQGTIGPRAAFRVELRARRGK